MRWLTLTLLILLALAGCKTPTKRSGTSLSAVNATNLPERRPSIKSIPASAKGNSQAWLSQQNAMLEAAAQLVTIYADSDIYFLARDGEYLYDLAVTLNPKAKNIKLINVSRDNLTSHKLLDYLAQEGLSEKSLQSGKLAVLVDSGFSGSIPNYIYEKFSAKA